MKVYVAGRTNMLDEVRRVQQLARGAGHEITYDWVANVIAEGGSASDKHVPHDRQVHYATCDRRGVLDSDCTIVVAGPKVCGTLIECGIALAFTGAIHVVLYCEPERESVFFELPEVTRIGTEEELLHFLIQGINDDPALRLQRAIPALRASRLRSD